MINITLKELRERAGMTQAEFAEFFGISKRNIENWESSSPTSRRKCPEYLLNLMEYKLCNEKKI